VGSWSMLLSATFKIVAMLADLPVSCTGWFAAPHRRLSSTLVSVYVTAGHCPIPHVVRTAEGLEQMAVLARITRPGMDAAVGLRQDARPLPTFPRLTALLPSAGDRALVAGYSDGHLTETILTAIEPCAAEFLCFHSDQALRPGMSGAPIMSLRTDGIVGIVVATERDSHGHDDPHTIMATPAGRLQALVDIAVPNALHPVPSGSQHGCALLALCDGRVPGPAAR
jgi:hypothetical protein